MTNSTDRRKTGKELHNLSSASLMIDNDERKLLKALLAIALRSESSRRWIIKKLGGEY